MKYELFVSLRYLKAKRKQSFISLITFISIGGVALGVAALIIVISVMTGFKEDLQEKILGAYSHLLILKHPLEEDVGIKTYTDIMKDIEDVKGVAASTPFIYGQVMFTSEVSVSGAFLRGIDVKTAPDVITLKDDLIMGDLSELEDGGEIKEKGDAPPKDVDGKLKGKGTEGDKETGDDVYGGITIFEFEEQEEREMSKNLPGVIIGKELAKLLGSVYGDEVVILSPKGDVTPFGFTPKMRRYRVVGLFDSGMYEFDSTFAFISISEAQSFFGMGDNVTGIEVKVDDIYNVSNIGKNIQAKLGLPYYTRNWMEMHKNIFAALQMEKIAMFVILAMIVFVAAFNIASTLIMVVMEKNKDIAILKSMGASSGGIMKIFMFEGLIIGVFGTFLGFVSGYIICFLLKRYEFIKLDPNVYYISTLPVKIVWSDILVIAASSLVLCLLATIYPAWQASRLDPAEAFRYE
ncbi:MAG: ABC transporter permease [Deltaproteobacteria bacterium]|uniref:ABC transporter permease n=1 Tax=Candidatus Zymogenus saltonus TaxID=2844893 RepID=A0A9D8KHY6_9DELT|nr:ABC transporter permease [Candidatus Zymogenus saltonus]